MNTVTTKQALSAIRATCKARGARVYGGWTNGAKPSGTKDRMVGVGVWCSPQQAQYLAAKCTRALAQYGAVVYATETKGTRNTYLRCACVLA